MSDALTDIARDKRITEWCERNLEPLFKKYFNNEITKEEIIQTLDKMRTDENTPNYRGYWSSSAREICGKLITDVKKDELDWLRKRL